MESAFVSFVLRAETWAAGLFGGIADAGKREVGKHMVRSEWMGWGMRVCL